MNDPFVWAARARLSPARVAAQEVERVCNAHGRSVARSSPPAACPRCDAIGSSAALPSIPHVLNQTGTSRGAFRAEAQRCLEELLLSIQQRPPGLPAGRDRGAHAAAGKKQQTPAGGQAGHLVADVLRSYACTRAIARCRDVGFRCAGTMHQGDLDPPGLVRSAGGVGTKNMLERLVPVCLLPGSAGPAGEFLLGSRFTPIASRAVVLPLAGRKRMAVCMGAEPG